MKWLSFSYVKLCPCICVLMCKSRLAPLLRTRCATSTSCTGSTGRRSSKTNGLSFFLFFSPDQLLFFKTKSLFVVQVCQCRATCLLLGKDLAHWRWSFSKILAFLFLVFFTKYLFSSDRSLYSFQGVFLTSPILKPPLWPKQGATDDNVQIFEDLR